MGQIYLNDLEQELENSNSLEAACQLLQKLLNGPFSATNEGIFYEIKGQIDSIRGVKLSINSREHAPPHFHVSYGRENGIFAILDCQLIEGNLSSRTKNTVYGWYKVKKSLLIKEWDASRPSDCPIGKYTRCPNCHCPRGCASESGRAPYPG